MKRVTWFVALWLLVFGGAARAQSLTLEDCLRLARTQNPDLQRAGLRPAQAEAEIGRARSGYLPRVDLQAGYTVQQEAQAASILGRTVPLQDPDYAHAGLRVHQTLYDFGRTGGRLAQARDVHEAARQELASFSQDVFLLTVTAYYRLLEDQRLLQAAAQEVEQMQEHLQRAEALFAQGVVTRNDVLQAEVQLASSRQLRLRRNNAVANDWLELNYLTGRTPQPDDALIEDQELAPIPPAEAEQAVASRPDIEARRLRLSASSEEVRRSRAEFFPELYVDGTADYLENSHYAEQTIYAASVGLKINLFSGGATSAAYRKALAARDEERRALDALTRRASLEYRNALNDSRVAEERIAVAEEAIVQGEENLRINQLRYREQVGTATDVIDAQTLLTRVRTEYYQARFEYQVALARLRRATGSL